MRLLQKGVESGFRQTGVLSELFQISSTRVWKKEINPNFPSLLKNAS
jgi:hypothetical protein